MHQPVESEELIEVKPIWGVSPLVECYAVWRQYQTQQIIQSLILPERLAAGHFSDSCHQFQQRVRYLFGIDVKPLESQHNVDSQGGDCHAIAVIPQVEQLEPEGASQARGSGSSSERF